MHRKNTMTISTPEKFHEKDGKRAEEKFSSVSDPPGNVKLRDILVRCLR